MKILLLDYNEIGVGMARDFMNDDHDVQMFVPMRPGGIANPVGDGMVKKVADWRKAVDGVDLIVLTDNASYRAELEPLFKAGYPIIGANQRSSELELDRDIGQRVLSQYGVEVANNEVFEDYDEAIKHVKTNADKVFVSKPWGGSSDKDLSYVSKNAADMIFMLETWKELGKIKGAFMLQERIEGYEMAVGGWFGPGGWCSIVNENWEEKRRMNDGLGENTGEMGTILRYVKKSKLFEMALEPCTDYLFASQYVGYVDMNCIIAKDGQPWPLEWTMRFGWPHWYISRALHRCDSAEFLYDLWKGKDSLVVSKNISCGIVMKRPNKDHAQAPIYGVTSKNEDNIHWEMVMEQQAPMMLDDTVKNVRTTCTAHEQVCVVTGTGTTVCKASEAAYKTAWELNWPGSREFRTDIGKHLEEDLPAMQGFGFAEGMKYK